MRNELSEAVVKALDGVFNVRSYSGRGMYGATCVGVDVDGVGRVMEITVALADAGMVDEDILEMAECTQWDNMGRGYIVYWPGLKLTPEDIAELFPQEKDEE